ncbi:MAG: amino acid permease [Candidatus Nealsonbacteria bacterium]|nr:amino acid permease [Candidatus Nealsonbacteria bacterium]
MWNFIKALSIFVGTIIGVGIFGLPYVTMQAGFPVVLFYFLMLTGVAIAIHLMYGEISLATKSLHRLPGLVGEYMGPRWKNFTLWIFMLGLLGALLAYLIVGGKFLNLFFSPYFGGSEAIYTLIFWAIGTLLIFQGIRSIAIIEITLLLVFFGLLALFFVKTTPFIAVDNFQNIDWKFFALPYGVVLFSLWGSDMIPEVKEVLGKDGRAMLKWVLISGISLAALTYLFFIYIIFGATGSQTSKEAIAGLVQVAGNGIIRTGFIFGIITCFTSFLTLGLTLKKGLWYDQGLNPHLSWFIACFLPLFLFFAGLRAFIDIIGLTGAVAIGLVGIIIVLLYKKFLWVEFNRKMNPFFYFFGLFFVIGIFLEIFYFVYAK